MALTYPFTSIIIPVFNEEENLPKCLRQLAQIEYPANKYETIIVDNGSTDKSVALASQFNVQIYSVPDVKVGAVRNFGADKASGDILVFLDSDCLVDKTWLKRGVEIIGQHDLDAVGGLFSLPENPSWIEKNWLIPGCDSSVYQNTFIGACIFIKAPVFREIGGFDEALNAGEDCDITVRLQDAGHAIRIDPTLNVVHLGYPKTIPDFLRRQIWQSSDAFERVLSFDLDKTLIVVTSLLTLLIALFTVYLFTLDPTYILISFTLFILSPLIFTAKRLARCGGFNVKHDYLSIYAVDFLYLTGRLTGLLKGLFFILNKGTSKTFK